MPINTDIAIPNQTIIGINQVEEIVI